MDLTQHIYLLLGFFLRDDAQKINHHIPKKYSQCLVDFTVTSVNQTRHIKVKRRQFPLLDSPTRREQTHDLEKASARDLGRDGSRFFPGLVDHTR